MPKNFVVPRTPYWPELAHGLPLGARVVALRARSIHALDTERAETAERVEVLTRLGFEWQKANAPATSKRFDIVLSALKAYLAKHGDTQVPFPFVVPDGDAEWPEQAWGVKLGARVRAIRTQGTFVKNNPERRKLLDDLGFEWQSKDLRKSRQTSTSAGDERVDDDNTGGAAKSLKDAAAWEEPARRKQRRTLSDEEQAEIDELAAVATGANGNDEDDASVEADTEDDDSDSVDFGYWGNTWDGDLTHPHTALPPESHHIVLSMQHGGYKPGPTYDYVVTGDGPAAGSMIDFMAIKPSYMSVLQVGSRDCAIRARVKVVLRWRASRAVNFSVGLGRGTPSRRPSRSPKSCGRRACSGRPAARRASAGKSMVTIRSQRRCHTGAGAELSSSFFFQTHHLTSSPRASRSRVFDVEPARV